LIKSDSYHGQELKLFKVYSLLNAVSALFFIPTAGRYIEPAFMPWMYAILIATAVVSIFLFLIIKKIKYQLGSILLISTIMTLSIISLLLHKSEFIVFSSVLVFSFIIIGNVLLSPWPIVLWFDGLIVLLSMFFMGYPKTGFQTSVAIYHIDPKYAITVIFIYYVALMVWGTSLVEIKRRTESKLRYLNNNLNQLVDEKVKELTNLDREKRDYQEQVESIYQHIPVGIIIMDKDMKFLYSNGIHFSLQNETISTVGEAPIPVSLLNEKIIHPNFNAVAKFGKKIIGHKLEYQQNSGQAKVIRYSFVPVAITSESSELFRLVIITEDITQEEYLREKLAQSDHLSELGKMAANLAHEVNNPLAGIKLYLELLEKGIRDKAKQEKVFATLENSINRIDHVVKGFLSFSRQEQPKRVNVDIPEIINETLEIAVGFKSLHHITIISELSDECPQLFVDRFKLGQVFLNLINNAKDAMYKTGGVLTIKTFCDQHYFNIEFKDNGEGIKQEDLQHIFTPFYTTKERGHGTGLGLSTCYGIIKEHGGTIDVFSKEGLGSSFTIKLPIQSETGRQA
jgi:signal transduction histidine kinase